MKEIKILIPIYNEEESILFLKNRILNVINEIKKYSFKILFIDDGSTDGSIDIVNEIRKIDSRFEYISFSRNFGKETAIIAGLDYSKNSDAVIIMDADLQDPPELIPQMIEEWENGYDDVYAKRKTRDGETWLKKTTSKLYYDILQKFTNIEVQKDTGDFRLLDKKCVQAICALRETSRCSKSLFNWIGFNKKEVLFDRQKRIAGKTKWNYKKLIDLAIDGITSLSVSPLRWAVYIAIPLFLILFVYFVVILCLSIINGQAINLSQIIILLILFFAEIQLALTGIIGEYLGRVFNQTKNRPLYLVKEINGEKNWENKNEEKSSNYININNINTNFN